MSQERSLMNQEAQAAAKAQMQARLLKQQALSGLGQQVLGNEMNAINQRAGLIGAQNSILMGRAGAQQAADAAQNQMWGQIGTGVGELAAMLLAPVTGGVSLSAIPVLKGMNAGQNAGYSAGQYYGG